MSNDTWPEGVVARYATAGGATVDLIGGGDLAQSRCTGCGHRSEFGHKSFVHEKAQAHAEQCRALPRPGAS